MSESRELLEDVLHLPIQSTVALQVLDLMDDPCCDARDLGHLLESDPALATRSIYLANSPFYGLAHPVTSTARAVTVLGLNSLRAIAASAAFGLLDPTIDLPPRFWEHAQETATATAAARGVTIGDAFCLGIVHDIGTALLFRRDPDAWWTATAGEDGRVDAELEVFAEDHASYGARALAAARFPAAIVEAVASHHDPSGLLAEPSGDDVPQPA